MAKPKKAASTDESLSMEEIIERLNKQFGEHTLIVASEAIKSAPTVTHIRTGIVAMDIALGGGIPRNRLIEVRGPFSSFKSTMSLLSVAAFQKAFPGGWAVYVDLERSCDLKYAQKLGVNLKRMIVVNPAFGEEAVNILNTVMKADTDLFVIIDSIAALVPTAEVEGDAAQAHMALQARLVNKAFRIINTRLKRSLYDDTAPATTVVCLNQLRSKVGVVFGDPEFSPGGMGKDFFYSVIIRLQSSPSKAVKEEVTINGRKQSVNKAQTVTFTIKKNKTGGSQHASGEFTFNYEDHDGRKAGTFDNSAALFHYGAFNDVIKLTSAGDYKFGPITKRREKDFIKALDASPKTSSLLFDKIIQAVRREEPMLASLKFGKSKPADEEEEDED